MEKAKPELAEGEMIENIEYENITSSDEEFSLPQLEARNPERENMNRISSAQGSEFGICIPNVEDFSDHEIDFDVPIDRCSRSQRKSDRSRQRKQSSRSERRRERSSPKQAIIPAPSSHDRNSRRSQNSRALGRHTARSYPYTKSRNIDTSSSDEDEYPLKQLDGLRATIWTSAQTHKSSSLQCRLKASFIPPPPPPSQFLDFTQPPPAVENYQQDVPSGSSSTKEPTAVLVGNGSAKVSLRSILLAKSGKAKTPKPQNSSKIMTVPPGASGSLANKSQKIKDQKENRIQPSNAAVKLINKDNIPNQEQKKLRKTYIVKPAAKLAAVGPVILKRMQNTNLPLSSQPTTENVPAIISAMEPAIAKESLQPEVTTKPVVTAKASAMPGTSKPVNTAKPVVTAKPMVTEKSVFTANAAGSANLAATKPAVTANAPLSATPAAAKSKIQNATPSVVRHLPESTRNVITGSEKPESLTAVSQPKDTVVTATKAKSLVKLNFQQDNLTIPAAIVETTQVPETLPENTLTIEPASAKNVPPTISPSLETTLLNMSATAKADLLKIREDEFTTHSNEFLSKIDDLHQTICAAQQAKRKKFALEHHLERLQAEVTQCETALANQKVYCSKLIPLLSASRDNIVKRRKKSVELSSSCKQIGAAIVGTSYKTPAAIRNSVVKRLRDISYEALVIKNITKTSFDPSTLPPIWSTFEMVQTECETDDDSVQNLQSNDANCFPDMVVGTPQYSDLSVSSDGSVRE